MIIFDLDGTLANCEHRRHFVNPYTSFGDFDKDFQSNWPAFYDACDKDEPIEPVIEIFAQLNDDEYNDTEIQIWSGRCESVRDKTEKWLRKNTSFFHMNARVLKMRPIGDNTPDEMLKERWLLDTLILSDIKIDFVFDDRPKVVRMWRRRGIFVFDCNQTGEEF